MTGILRHLDLQRSGPATIRPNSMLIADDPDLSELWQVGVGHVGYNWFGAKRGIPFCPPDDFLVGNDAMLPDDDVTLNGQPSLTMTNAGLQRLLTPAGVNVLPTGEASWSVGIVFRPSVGSDSGTLVSNESGATGTSFKLLLSGTEPANELQVAPKGTAILTTTSAPFTTNAEGGVYGLATFEYQDSTHQLITVYKNGTMVKQSPLSDFYAHLNINSRLALGARSAGGQNYEGHYFAVFVHNTSLEADDAKRALYDQWVYETYGLGTP